MAETLKIDNRMLGVIAALALIALLIYTYSPTLQGRSEEMIVAKGDTVTVEYSGQLEDGTVFDPGDKPLTFVVGSGQVIDGFDNAVIGMKLGERKYPILQPNEAYGDHKNYLVVALDTKNSTQKPKVGDTISRPEGSGRIYGKVLAVNSTHATVDFNHELAGKVLQFYIKVTDIKKKS